MLPIDKAWYKKLLWLSLVIGAVGGIAALLFMGITGAGTNFLFGGTRSGWWSGNWWWILLTAVGGLIVALLRKAWQIPEEVPGSIALANTAWVDPASAPYWVLISTISILAGASLGPSFALIVMGGAFGSWLATRLKEEEDDELEEARQEYTLTGMAGGLGAAFSAPLFAAVLASELSPTSKRNYVAAFIPQLIAATIGFMLFFGVTGTSILGSYELPPYEYSVTNLLIGALLGVFSAFILIVFALILKLVSSAAAQITNPLIRGPIAGALVGLIAFALPLTATSGSSQLATELQMAAALGVGFLTVVLLAKMAAIALSRASGFLGGIVFPIIFLGGTAGILVHTIFPDIPIALSVGAMLGALPGAFLSAPLTLIIIAAGTVRIGPEAMAPIAIAVVTSHVTLALIQNYIIRERQIQLRGD